MVRQAKTKKLVDDFFEIVHENYDILDEAPWNEKFKKAISYAYLQEEKLRRVLEYGEAELSTNQIETTIRNFAIGRNNWMFFNTISGAKAGTALYSIIVTAKENGLKVYDYLEYLFDQIRNIEMSEEELSKIMPWSKEIPEEIKKTKKA